MDEIESVRAAIKLNRKKLKLSQEALAERAQISLPTIRALEQGRLGELGFTKVARILAVLGLELKLGPMNQGRPTLEELQQETDHD